MFMPAATHATRPAVPFGNRFVTRTQWRWRMCATARPRRSDPLAPSTAPLPALAWTSPKSTEAPMRGKAARRIVTLAVAALTVTGATAAAASPQRPDRPAGDPGRRSSDLPSGPDEPDPRRFTLVTGDVVEARCSGPSPLRESQRCRTGSQGS
ncbi:hypothetical protein BN11_50053 [Nostocoides australiense Ben110]|uniref:Uncharacterized protein n=1 Tax=Nostocoides australiense Ben110 TaxID=1193182 RepID=W6K0Q2_9MICO|nr:hypothetical protein BN11_50053 [Tetrasphaera australiensis Ben110]